jgi:hypothetical protein
MLLLLTGWAMMNLSLFFSSSESLLGTMQEEELKENFRSWFQETAVFYRV